MSAATKPAVALGIDLGTSGVRAALLSEDSALVDIAAFPFPDAAAARLPSIWWAGVQSCLAELASRNSFASLEGLAVDGTSGTVLAVDVDGMPVGRALMYNDPCPDPTVVDRIAAQAPADSPARGATSALARAIHLSRRPGVCGVMHQADWILMKLGL
ncbi:MAG: FGGY family carbohydrate kinase, partial [Shinella sp.]